MWISEQGKIYQKIIDYFKFRSKKSTEWRLFNIKRTTVVVYLIDTLGLNCLKIKKAEIKQLDTHQTITAGLGNKRLHLSLKLLFYIHNQNEYPEAQFHNKYF